MVFTGRVTLPGGEPATGARVRGFRSEFKEGAMVNILEEETIVDADGRYRLASKGAGSNYILSATRDGSARVDYFLLIMTGNAISRDFILPPTVPLAGCVVDEEGKPVSGVRVSFWRDVPTHTSFGTSQKITRSEAVTGEDGRFRMEDIPEGRGSIAVSSPKHLTLTKEVNAPNEDLRLNVQSGNLVIDGGVFDKETGEAIPGAAVSLVMAADRSHPLLSRASLKITADKLGRFRFEPHRRGEFYLKAKKNGYTYHSTYSERGSTNAFEGDETHKQIDIRLEKAGRRAIRGTVTEKGTGRPLEGVQVGGSRVTDITGPDGTYLLPDVPQRVGLFAKKEGYCYYELLPPMNFGDDEQEKIIDIELSRLIALSGRVTLPDGSPAPSARVAFSLYEDPHFHGNKDSRVDPEGKFRFQVKGGSSYRIYSDAKGFSPVVSPRIDVALEPVTDILLELEEPASLEGLVLDADGCALEKSTVYVWSAVFDPFDSPVEPGWKNWKTLSDEKGRFRISGISAGDLYVAAETEGIGRIGLLRIQLEPGEARTGILFQIPGTKFIAGRIMDTDGKPVQGVDVTTNVSHYSRSGPEGHYSVEGLKEGTYELRLSIPQSLREIYEIPDISKRAETGREDVDFTLRRRSIKDQTSNPNNR